MTLLVLENISKDFKDGNTVINALKKTNLAIERGKFVAITGPSGSGKSTLLTILGLLQKPTSGNFYLQNQSMLGLDPKQQEAVRFRQIGFILQSSNLIPFLRVKEQFAFIDKLNKIKNKNNNHDKLFTLLGIEDLQNKFIHELSGGQKQRVAIARALYNKPDLILADEPTSALDSEKAVAVVELLAMITKQQGGTVIMVTHDLRMTKQCDQIYNMADGILTQAK